MHHLFLMPVAEMIYCNDAFFFFSLTLFGSTGTHLGFYFILWVCCFVAGDGGSGTEWLTHFFFYSFFSGRNAFKYTQYITQPSDRKRVYFGGHDNDWAKIFFFFFFMQVPSRHLTGTSQNDEVVFFFRQIWFFGNFFLIFKSLYDFFLWIPVGEAKSWFFCRLFLMILFILFFFYPFFIFIFSLFPG